MNVRAIAIAVTASMLGVRGVPAQQRFTSRAEGVRVDVLVADGSRTVRGLTADDFEIRDDGVLQRVTAIDVEHVPLDVIGVFDVSGSVAGVRLRELVAAGRAVVDQLRETDRIAILPFATHISLPLPLTNDFARARQVLDGLRASGATSLRDATFAGLALRDDNQSRTLVLVFTDGADTASFLGAPRVLDAAKRSDAVVCAVRVGQGSRPQAPFASPPLRGHPPPSPFDARTTFLDDIAAETGGSVTSIAEDRALTATFTSILGEFRDRYVLSYSAEGVSPSGWHELSVKVKKRSVTVTARRGYFAGVR